MWASRSERIGHVVFALPGYPLNSQRTPSLLLLSIHHARKIAGLNCFVKRNGGSRLQERCGVVTGPRLDHVARRGEGDPGVLRTRCRRNCEFPPIPRREHRSRLDGRQGRKLAPSPAPSPVGRGLG